MEWEIWTRSPLRPKLFAMLPNIEPQGIRPVESNTHSPLVGIISYDRNSGGFKWTFFFSLCLVLFRICWDWNSYLRGWTSPAGSDTWPCTLVSMKYFYFVWQLEPFFHMDISYIYLRIIKLQCLYDIISNAMWFSFLIEIKESFTLRFIFKTHTNRLQRS